MKAFGRKTGLLVCAAFVGVQIAGCFSDRDGVTDPTVDAVCDIPVSVVGPGKIAIGIHGYRFLTDTLRVSRGTTVTWVNCDNVAKQDAHTVTSDSDPPVWDSPFFGEGAMYTRTFNTAGTFPYHCVPHTQMTAVIIVQ